MRTGVHDLDDVDELIAADTDGLLHTIALTGAQVRSVAEAVNEGVTAPLADLRPRSVVIVCAAGGPAAAAVALITSVLATRVDVPIISAPGLPGWVGPLDVVVLAGVDGGDMVLADAAARAVRRRAEVVTAAPIEGPLRDALGGNGINLSPRVVVDPRLRFAGFVAVFLAVFGSLTQVRFTGAAVSVADLADALDAEAAADHPGRETFRNQAKLLAARLTDSAVVFAGDSPATAAIATHAAAQVFALAGKPAAAVDLVEIAQVWRNFYADYDAAGRDSIFYDPQIDGPRAQTPPHVLVASTGAREWQTQRRVAGIGGAEVITGDDPDASERLPRHPGPPGGAEEFVDAPADLVSLLVLVLRIDLAAVYFRLIGAEQG